MTVHFTLVLHGALMQRFKVCVEPDSFDWMERFLESVDHKNTRLNQFVYMLINIFFISWTNHFIQLCSTIKMTHPLTTTTMTTEWNGFGFMGLVPFWRSAIKY